MNNKKLIKHLFFILAPLISSCANNTSRWMLDSKSSIQKKHITKIIIPGSHIANGYSVTSNNPICIGEISPQSYTNNGIISQNLLKYGNTSDSIQQLFIDQLNTQEVDINTQLKYGIRYLDIQVCLQNNVFYTSNLYLTDTFNDVTHQIKSFLSSNPSEIVILDLDNNLRAEYGYLNESDIAQLHNNLVDTFGSLIIPKSESSSNIGQLQNKHYQLIILSSNPILSTYPDIWDKNQSVEATETQASTIQTLSILETSLSNNQSEDKFSILPSYSEIRTETLLSDKNDSDADQDIILSYLEQNITNHPGIIVLNKTDASFIEDWIIQGDINSSLKLSTESSEAITFESSSIYALESNTSYVSESNSESSTSSTNNIESSSSNKVINP